MSQAGGAVLITGCSSGIGRATALRLARDGRPVVATARRTETLAVLADAGCEVLALDVTDEESMRAAVDTVVERHGTVGVLVNNAGYSQAGAIETLEMAALRRQFETNVFGLVRMCQLALPGMRAQRWGRIVNISSMGANFTFPGAGAYHATKYAVEAISDALRFEVAGFGVGVTIVQPGLIRTEFAGTAASELPVDDGPYGRFHVAVAGMTVEAYTRGPLARLGGTADDVAAAVAAAIRARRAPIRVRVTPSAHILIAQRRLLPAALWDRLMRSRFPTPSAGD